MEHQMKTADASYDARMSQSNLPINHWEILGSVEHEYFHLLRLFFGDENSSEVDLRGKETKMFGSLGERDYMLENVGEGNQMKSHNAYVIKEEKTHGCKRRLSELSGENNIDQLENELEDVLTSLSEVEGDGTENESERFFRNFNEFKRIKNMVLEMENSMNEKAKQLMLILKGYEVPSENSVQEDLNVSCNVDEECLVQGEEINQSVKTEPSQYIPDEDVEVLDYDSFVKEGNPSSFVPRKSNLADLTENNPLVVAQREFRRELMEVLRKPFDKEEYGNLSKLFEEGSYRHSVPDVGRKLKIFRYKREKRMNVFRGFFFWLENVTREGSFKPWDDNECLAI